MWIGLARRLFEVIRRSSVFLFGSLLYEASAKLGHMSFGRQEIWLRESIFGHYFNECRETPRTLEPGLERTG